MLTGTAEASFSFSNTPISPQVAQLPIVIQGNVWEILKLSSNVLKCNKIVQFARLSCMVVMFLGRLGAI